MRYASPVDGLKRLCATTRKAATLVAALLLACQASYAAQQTIEWSDRTCNYRVRFDPKKYDATRVKNTGNFVFSGYLHEFPLPQAYLKPGGFGVDEFRDACARHSRAIETLDLIDLPGVEAYRGLELEQLQDWCDFGVVLIRGTFGDISALRSFKAASQSCSRYADALEGKTDLTQMWREVITSQCKNNYKPETCMAAFLAAEGQPDAAERIRSDVLTYGWQNCSVRYLKTSNTNPVSRDAALVEQELEIKFRARFRVTARCDD